MVEAKRGHYLKVGFKEPGKLFDRWKSAIDASRGRVILLI
jgi:hypothetical protein